ncbi:MAG: sortase-associated OmpA-like protein PdsO [Pseudomonadales bacterium]|nr:sortase-associated OmpA-like protein PdsO [Pseudomonadales bacterium]
MQTSTRLKPLWKDATPFLASLVLSSALLMPSLLVSNGAQATDTDKLDYDPAALEKNRAEKESAGIIGGVILGGLIAGPAGAIGTAIFGGLLGNGVHVIEERQILTASLAASKTELAALQEKNRSLEAQYALSQTGASAELHSIRFGDDAKPDATTGSVNCCADTKINLHFKTDSSLIEPHYRENLQALAALGKKMPKATIEISAYADRRGSKEHNLQLSQRRVEAVRSALVELGMKTTSIHTAAYGASRPLTASESLEGNFYDRRAEIIIHSNRQFVTQATTHE